MQQSLEPPPAVAPAPAAVASRTHLRLQGWDYTSPGWYFLTMCTQNMRSVFGTVVNGRMILNEAGKIAGQCWREIPAHFPHAVLDEFMVMPNHLHGLQQLAGSTAGHGRALEAFGQPVAGSVPTIVRSYKGAVTHALGDRLWQRRFYDVRVRDDATLANIRRYIRDNPQNYTAVMQGAQTQYLGNRALLDLPKVGFLASRGKACPPACLPAKPGEAIISGFLSPMEHAVFMACLKYRQPMICITACRDATEVEFRGIFRSLTACRDATDPAARGIFSSITACRDACRDAIVEGRLLVVSPFAPGVATPNARRAAWCNEYVLAHCQRLVVGHLNPDGMLACILSETNPDMEVVYL